MSRKFYLYQRNGIYYAQIRNPLTGNYLTGKSTGKHDRDEAAYVAMEWLKKGIPKSRTKWKRNPVLVFQNEKLFQAVSDSQLDEIEVNHLLLLLRLKGYVNNEGVLTENRSPLPLLPF